MSSPPSVLQSTVAPCFNGTPDFLHRHSCLRISFLPPPQAVSSQPTALLPPVLLFYPHAPAPSPHVHCWTHVPIRGMHGHVTDHLCSSHSFLSATDQLLHPPPTASDVSSLSQLISPLVRGFPRMWETLLCFSSPPGAQVPSCILSSSFSLLSFILPGYAGIFIVLSSVRDLLLVFAGVLQELFHP